MLHKTKYQGVYYELLKHNVKSYVLRFYINNKEHKIYIGHSPQYTDKSAFLQRQKLIDEKKQGKKDLLNISLQEAFLYYLDLKKYSMSQSWYKSNKTDFNKHLKPKIGHLHVNKITTEHIQKICNNLLQTEYKKGHTYKPKTVKIVKDALQSFYQYLIDNQYSIINPCKSVILPAYDNERDFTLTLDQSKKLFKTILNYDNLKFRTIYIFLLHGRRKGEVLTLTKEDLNFNNNTYRIQFQNSKRRKQAIHPMTPLLVHALNEYFQAHPIKDGLIFPGQKGNISKCGFDYHWQKIKKEADLQNEDIVPHDIRHLIGTLSVNDGMSYERIGKVLDHTNPQTTKRYSSVNHDNVTDLLSHLFKKLSD